jgi:hypothetical protein|uniref:hypothetical protein n=1 Tax=Prosthecobacter sp. TaxID=1965333 RepID=UPI003784E0E9
MAATSLKLNRNEAPDHCPSSVTEVLKSCGDLLNELEGRFGQSMSLADCRSKSKDTRQSLIKTFKLQEVKEHGKTVARGLYVMFDGSSATRESAFYVGVSNDVPNRLSGHLAGKTPAQSSLVYLLMKRHLEEDDPSALWAKDDETGKLKEKTRKVLFAENRKYCERIAQELMNTCRVVIQPVPDVVSLHVLEAMAAVEFKSGPWNSFRPH